MVEQINFFKSVILFKVIGDGTLPEICGRWGTPLLGIVACTVNTPTLQPYIFRTYGHPNGNESHYRGGCNHKTWEALQASAAAPGYFQEVSTHCLPFKIDSCNGIKTLVLKSHETFIF